MPLLSKRKFEVFASDENSKRQFMLKCDSIMINFSEFDFSFLLYYLNHKKSYSELQCEELLRELLRFLALKVALSDLSVPSALVPSQEIQDVWNAFLLFPKKYKDFCNSITDIDGDDKIIDTTPLDVITEKDRVLHKEKFRHTVGSYRKGIFL